MEKRERELKAREEQIEARERAVHAREQAIAGREAREKKGGLYGKVEIPIPVLNGIILVLLAILAAIFILASK